MLAQFKVVFVSVLTTCLWTLTPSALAQAPWPETVRSASSAEVHAVLETGVDLGQRDEQGYTALMVAALFNPDTAVTELLVEAGSDLEARTNAGATVLHLAVRRDVPLERLLVLLRAGADPRARNASGETPLMIAASSSSRSAAIRELILSGAEVDARDTRGSSATHYAAESGATPDVLNALIEAGASIDARDREGRTPLMVATMGAGKIELVRILIDAGSQINATDAEGRTPLMYAVAHNPDSRVAGELIAAGAELELPDSGGRTALMHAAASSMDPAIVDVLLEAGANAGARSDGGEFPADYSLRNETLRDTSIYDRLRAAATAREQVLFREFQRLETPIAVVVAGEDPSSVQGIGSASQVYQMPVSRDRSGLLLVFEEIVPERIGPVDPVEAHFVEVAMSLDAILVHDGGSSGALAVLGAVPTFGPSLDAQRGMDSFEPRGASTGTPLYAIGELLLQAVIGQGDGSGYRILRVEPFRVPADLPDARQVEVHLMGTGVTTFAFQEGAGAYQLVPDQSLGQTDEPDVFVDAVLVGMIEARAFPNDPEGRLNIPLRGGRARLYLHGKLIEARWRLGEGGVEFFSDSLGSINLTPFKTWIVLTPNY